MINMLFNPFTLSGTYFLIFYGVLGLVIFYATKAIINRRESRLGSVNLNLSDPYEIAMLRGKEHETINIAIISLTDRGLLLAIGDKLQTKDDKVVHHVRLPLEKAILNMYLTPAKVKEIYNNSTIKQACLPYQASLKSRRLLASTKDYFLRICIVALASALLIGIALTKIIIAVNEGHTNVWYLSIIAIFFVLPLLKFIRKPRTTLGDQAIDDLRRLFKGFRRRQKSVIEANQVALIAAVFGIAYIADPKFAYLKKLFPYAHTPSQTNCSTGGSCDSGCGGGCSAGCGGCSS
ncbi:MAG: TIGR04222 domain-containing membrane protein [Proteobacteria bacterium]|nr:TIGR04222 domain-containing membrane protein [Pseudomonadota bacterium]